MYDGNYKTCITHPVGRVRVRVRIRAKSFLINATRKSLSMLTIVLFFECNGRTYFFSLLCLEGEWVYYQSRHSATAKAINMGHYCPPWMRVSGSDHDHDHDCDCDCGSGLRLRMCKMGGLLMADAVWHTYVRMGKCKAQIAAGPVSENQIPSGPSPF